MAIAVISPYLLQLHRDERNGFVEGVVTVSSIEGRLRPLVIKNSRLKIDAISEDQALNFDLGYDSHALLNLLLDIEDEFGLEVPPDQVPEYVGVSFGKLVEMIQSHVEGM